MKARIYEVSIVKDGRVDGFTPYEAAHARPPLYRLRYKRNGWVKITSAYEVVAITVKGKL